jgi:hypothetical protein
MDAATGPVAHPLAIGQVVARNVVPVVGVIAFGWPAFNVLLLYFVDTLLAMGVMFAGLAAWFSRGTEDGAASRASSVVGAIALAAFLCVVFAVPLGMPLLFVGAAAGGTATWAALLEDRSLWTGIAWQVVAAVWSYWGLWQALRHRSPDELGLKRRFALVFLRWFVIVAAVYLPLAWVFGRFLPFVLVLLYVATSIVVEIAPDRFLRLMPGGAADAAPPAPAAPPKRYSRTKKKP